MPFTDKGKPRADGTRAWGPDIIPYSSFLTHYTDSKHPTRGICGVGPPWESKLLRTLNLNEVTCPACLRILVGLQDLPTDTDQPPKQ